MPPPPVRPLSVNVRGRFGFGSTLFVTMGVAVVTANLGRLPFERASALVAFALSALLTLPVLALGLWLAVRNGSRRIVVGDDGVRLVRAPMTRFVPFADLSSVEAARALNVRGKSGRPEDDHYYPIVRLSIAGSAPLELPMVGAPEELGLRVVARIQEGIATARRTQPRRTLDRDGRSVTEWRAALANDVQSGNFRERALTPEALDAVLADPMSRAEDRVGAALALRATDTEGAPERIRVAASTSANPRLRVALDAVAEDTLDDETLEAALEADSSTR